MYNKLFWIVFIISAIVSFVLGIGNLFWIGMVFGLFLVLLGIAKVEQDSANKEIADSFEEIEREMEKISENFEKNHLFTEASKDKSEKRIQNIDAKRVEADKKVEKMYRDIVKKIIEVENKINRIEKGSKK